jgi:hypothetical protein
VQVVESVLEVDLMVIEVAKVVKFVVVVAYWSMVVGLVGHIGFVNGIRYIVAT